MSPVQWAIRPLKKYATFSGRAPRAEFWWFFLFVFIFYFLVSFLLLGSMTGIASSDPSAGLMGLMGGGAAIFIGLFWLALLIPTIAVQVRRLHDTNRSGWWVLGFYVIYVVYMFVTLGAAASAAADGTISQSSMTALAGAGIVSLIMLIYGIALLVFYCLPGTKGTNRFGPDPYGEEIEQVFA